MEQNRIHWPVALTQALGEHVAHATKRLNTARYRGREAYLTALLARLDGVAYDGRSGRLEFRASIAIGDQRNMPPNWGADFAIVAEFVQGSMEVRKAVLGQMKWCDIDELERGQLGDQMATMSEQTESVITLGVSRGTEEGPRVRIGREDSGDMMRFEEYLSKCLLACTHGDSRPGFLQRVQNAHLCRLDVICSGQAPRVARGPILP